QEEGPNEKPLLLTRTRDRRRGRPRAKRNHGVLTFWEPPRGANPGSNVTADTRRGMIGHKPEAPTKGDPSLALQACVSVSRAGVNFGQSPRRRSGGPGAADASALARMSGVLVVALLCPAGIAEWRNRWGCAGRERDRG